MDELQEALKDLRGIHEPDFIAFWPPAPGWWVLLVLVFLLLVLAIWWLKRKNSVNYKKIANDELKNIRANYDIQRNSHKAASELVLLIRKTLIATNSHEQVSALIDEEWLSYLDKKSGTDLFTQGAGRVITTVIYQKEADVDVEGLFAATKVLLKNV